MFAAARALRRGRQDAAAATGGREQRARPTSGDATAASSVGADYAVFCADSVFPWDKSAPEATRRAQYEAAAKAVPDSATAPFSVAAWTGFVASQPVLLIPGADACTPWPAPMRPEPPFPPRQPFPAGVPALLLGGGLDYLDVAPSGRCCRCSPAGRVRDGRQRRSRDHAVEPLRGGHRRPLPRDAPPGDTTCAADTQGRPGIRSVRAGRAADPGRRALPASRPPRSRRRRPARDARARAARGRGRWAAVEDAVYQTPRLAGTTGRGLRGGTFTVKQGKRQDRLPRARASAATSPSPAGVARPRTSRVTGRITVTGALSGTLRVARRCGIPTSRTPRCAGRSAGSASPCSLPHAENGASPPALAQSRSSRGGGLR